MKLTDAEGEECSARSRQGICWTCTAVARRTRYSCCGVPYRGLTRTCTDLDRLTLVSRHRLPTQVLEPAWNPPGIRRVEGPKGRHHPPSTPPSTNRPPTHPPLHTRDANPIFHPSPVAPSQFCNFCWCHSPGRSFVPVHNNRSTRYIVSCWRTSRKCLDPHPSPSSPSPASRINDSTPCLRNTSHHIVHSFFVSVTYSEPAHSPTSSAPHLLPVAFDQPSNHTTSAVGATCSSGRSAQRYLARHDNNKPSSPASASCWASPRSSTKFNHLCVVIGDLATMIQSHAVIALPQLAC